MDDSGQYFTLVATFVTPWPVDVYVWISSSDRTTPTFELQYLETNLDKNCTILSCRVLAQMDGLFL